MGLKKNRKKCGRDRWVNSTAGTLGMVASSGLEKLTEREMERTGTMFLTSSQFCLDAGNHSFALSGGEKASTET